MLVVSILWMLSLVRQLLKYADCLWRSVRSTDAEFAQVLGVKNELFGMDFGETYSYFQ